MIVVLICIDREWDDEDRKLQKVKKKLPRRARP